MRYRRSVINLVLSVLLVTVPAVGWWQRNAIYDAVRLYGYSVPPGVANLAARNTMTNYGQHLFYINHPQLVGDSATFRASCTVTEQTIVLGCYHPLQQGIFVYSVGDPRLAGVQEVTAAHEMLHAAYDRLSANDKNYINGLLSDYFDRNLRDQRIQDTINAYKKTEPKDVVNEMHSVFGTEVANLPAPLENYYKRYFVNRMAVVSFSQNYENEFTSRNSKAAQYEKQLNALKAKITAEETVLRSQLAKINNEQVRLDSLRNSGQIDAYNAGVSPYNNEVDAYNAGIVGYKRDINDFNALVEQYNAIAGELKQLYSAIDTRLAPKAQ